MDERNDSTVTKDLLTDKENGTPNTRNSPKFQPKTNTLKYLILTLSILSVLLLAALIITVTSRSSSKCSSDLETLKSDDKENNLSPVLENTAVKNIVVLPGNAKWNHSRLPDAFKPSEYTLDLKIDVIKREFYGNCSIIFHCSEDISILVLHSDVNIKFSSPSYLPNINEINADTREVIGTVQVAKIEVNQFYTYIILVLKAGEKFKKNSSYSVLIENYYSVITNNLKGIYYSTYQTKEGLSKPLVVSQLQPLDARAVFPSFDEPNLKATFAISITHQKGMINLLDEL